MGMKTLFRWCVACVGCACALVFAWRAGAQAGQGQQQPSQAMLEADGPPLVTAWTPPVYPEELKGAKPPPSGSVTVHFIVSETGGVGNVRAAGSTDKRFEAAAVASVEKWVCSPGVDSGKPVAMSVSARLFFKWPDANAKKPSLSPPVESLPQMLPRTSAEPVSKPDDVAFPAWILERITKGTVLADLQIDTHGKVSGVTILAATHPDFVLRSEKKFREWTFKPASQGELLVFSTVRASLRFTQPFEKQPDATPGDVFKLAPPDGIAADDYCDNMPERVTVPDPVFPCDLALAGKSGEATVRFTVGERGAISDVSVVSATEPAFGQSLEAAVADSEIKAAYKAGKAVPIAMTWTHYFRQPSEQPLVNNEGDSLESAEARMIRFLRNGGAVAGAKGLDGGLRPVWRAMPKFPVALKAKGVSNGSAKIEFIINSEGRACLPRVVEATEPEFGWAAMSALNQWVFDPPTRGGQPADVRVQVPFGF